MLSEELFPVSRIKARKVDMLSLLDCIFLVLAIFFYLILFMVRHEGVDIELPESDSSQENLEFFAAVSITKDNSVYLNGELVNAEQLATKIGMLYSQNSELKVFVGGNGETEYQNVIEVLDRIRSAGITDVSLETTAE